jgi:hypothetical protein
MHHRLYQQQRLPRQPRVTSGSTLAHSISCHIQCHGPLDAASSYRLSGGRRARSKSLTIEVLADRIEQARHELLNLAGGEPAHLH